MIYYDDHTIRIRDLESTDPQQIADGEKAQGWVNASPSKYEMRLRHRAEGKCIALAADYKGQVAGYINVYPDSKWGAFGNLGLPEIIDFGVLQKFQRNGIGSKLMDVAEQISATYADTVYLGVGLHSGYGNAQRMYVKRGYIPDGSGVWYGPHVCTPYKTCCNDDSLTLYLSKKLR